MATGSVIKRGKNYSIVFYDQDGKQKWRTIGPKKAEADKALRDIMGAVDRQEYSDKNIAFNDLVDAWLKSIQHQVKKSTLEFYTNISAHLVEHFNNRQVRNIQPKDIEGYIADRIGKLSNRTLGYHVLVAKQIFKKAVIWRYCHNNPAEYVKRPKPEHREAEIFTSEQTDKLLAAATGQTRLLILTAILSGMRAGELMALRWSDVDLVEGRINVARNYVRGEITTPKSRGSIRAIIIPPVLVDELARHKDAALNNDLVFTDSKGGPLEWHNFVSRQFAPLLKTAGLPHIKFHSLRHCYASTLVAAGLDLKFIQTQLGHSSLTMTLNTYSHLMREKSADAVLKIQAAFTAIKTPV